MPAQRNFIQTIFLVGAIFLVICSVIGFVGREYWLFDLFAHFRVYYLIAALVLFGIAAYVKLWSVAILSLAILTFNAVLVFPVYRATGVETPPTETLTLLSLNVNHDSVPTEMLAQLMKDHQPEVVVLAETSQSRVIELSQTVPTYANTLFAPREGRQNFGVGMLVVDTEEARLQIKDYSDVDVLGIEAELIVNQRACTIVGIHMMYPFGRERTRIRDHQLREVAEQARESSCLIAIGDMNVTPWSPVFGEALKTGDLKDSRVGFGIKTSWPVWLPQLFRIPIDHALVSHDVQVIRREVLAPVVSDHLPLLITVSVSTKAKD